MIDVITGVFPVKLTGMEMIRKIQNWLKFNLMYLRKPRWDTGISPPELLQFIEEHPPGRALDLGCGTGTNVLTLAKNGWSVTGIDFIPQAIAQAKQKAKEAGLKVDFRVGNVTNLVALKEQFDLILDLGCFHSLDSSSKRKYISSLETLLAPQGTYMLYAFFTNTSSQGPGVNQAEIEQIGNNLQLYRQEFGTDHGIRRSAWFWFRKASITDSQERRGPRKME